MDGSLQQTLKSDVIFQGVGLHSGAPARLVLRPAPADHGVVFYRADLGADSVATRIGARWDCVVPSKLCTLVANAAGANVSTIEHIMAALAGCGVQNTLIEIDGPEVPILDGSAAQFVQGILTVGIAQLSAPIRAIRILKTIEVRNGDALARLEPSDMLEIDFEIDFAEAAIGRQSKSLNMANGAFVRELSDSRTFCRNADVLIMRARGLALGGTMENAIVFEGDRVLTPGGLRYHDEPVRHKMLDALGDLALACAPILVRYTGVKAGHAMTNRLLHALFADTNAWIELDCESRISGKLPGVGVHQGDLPRIS
jgi:UDP-3-O-[3-hydroxymyristoyl] N-acetylglucosamine deacetylase